MASLLTLLGWLSIALTLKGSHNFSKYFFDSWIYAGVVATTLTVLYVALLEYILLIAGVAAIVLGLWVPFKRLGGSSSSTDSTGTEDRNSDSENVRSDPSNLDGRLNAYSSRRCSNCGSFFPAGSSYCGECGHEVRGDGA